MSTIYVSQETKKELVKIAGELQIKFGFKVNFDKVIRFLIEHYKKEKRRAELFELFTQPIKGVTFDEAYNELIQERRRDI